MSPFSAAGGELTSQSLLFDALCTGTLLTAFSDIRSFQNASGAFAEYHSDHSFEINPPSYTMLRMVRTPEYGAHVTSIFFTNVYVYDVLIV